LIAADPAIPRAFMPALLQIEKVGSMAANFPSFAATGE
jgi:hypothetical protein